MSDYYHDYVFDYLTNDIITIKFSYDVPIILLRNFNSKKTLQQILKISLNMKGQF